MSKTKFLLTFAAVTLLIAGTDRVSAQSLNDGLALGPSARPFEVTESAIIDTDYYEYDAQLWAPYDITSPDGRQYWQTGFYFELDYSYISLTRPKPVPGADPRSFDVGEDFHWARTMEFGWYSTNNDGWAASWLDFEGITYVNGSNPVVRNPMLLRTKYDQVMLNRQFRQRLSSGGWIEPYAGFRYFTLNDQTTQDGTPLVGFPRAFRFFQKVTNSALGGHVGTRYFRQFERLTWSGNIALGAMYNTQDYFSSSWQQGTAVIPNANVEISNTDSTVLPVLDLGLRLDIALTRDVSFRVGTTLQYMWQGMARADIRTAGSNPNYRFIPGTAIQKAVPAPASIQSEDEMVAAGFVFGLNWKR